jgi:hypothetical protein
MKRFLFALALILFSTSNALACACGCGVSMVGNSSLIPQCKGGIAFLQYDYLNQNRNWSKDEKSAAQNNEDRQIKSQVVTAGMQYMFNQKWGVNVRVPYVTRSTQMVMVDEMTGDEMLMHGRVNSLGDIRISAIYAGFFDDMSTGITFGLKLPTGKSNAKAFDRQDMQIGTGTTDSLLGAYHVGKIGDSGNVNWFIQGNWQHALNSHNGYRPGDEFSGASGISYGINSVPGIDRVTPILQVIGSKKAHDTGFASNPLNSGYSHAYFAPALQLNFGELRTYFDVEFPLYQNTNGNQLVPTRIYKLILGYNF